MILFASSVFFYRTAGELDWVIYLLGCVMLMLVVTKLLFTNNYSAFGNLERFVEINDNQGLFALVFQVMFALLLGALLLPSLTTDYDYIFHTPMLKTVAFAVLILLYFLLKKIITNIGVYAFKIQVDRQKNSKITSYFKIYEVGLLFVSVPVYYFSSLPETTVLVAFTIIFLIINALKLRETFAGSTGKETKIWYYNILYLCALEILPLFVLFKFLTKW